MICGTFFRSWWYSGSICGFGFHLVELPFHRPSKPNKIEEDGVLQLPILTSLSSTSRTWLAARILVKWCSRSVSLSAALSPPPWATRSSSQWCGLVICNYLLRLPHFEMPSTCQNRADGPYWEFALQILVKRATHILSQPFPLLRFVLLPAIIYIMVLICAYLLIVCTTWVI